MLCIELYKNFTSHEKYGEFRLLLVIWKEKECVCSDFRSYSERSKIKTQAFSKEHICIIRNRIHFLTVFFFPFFLSIFAHTRTH